MDNGESSYRRFLEGDESAFDEIVDSLFYSLIYFVNGYLPFFSVTSISAQKRLFAIRAPAFMKEAFSDTI